MDPSDAFSLFLWWNDINTESMIAAGAPGMTVSFTSSVDGSTDALERIDVFVLVVVKV